MRSEAAWGDGKTDGARNRSAVLRDKLEKWAPNIDAAATRGFNAPRIAAAMMLAVTEKPQLLQCTAASVFLSVVKCARLALDIGDGIFLVPLARTLRDETRILECHAWPSYTGLKALATRQGIIRTMTEYEVYEADDFDFTYGTQEWLTHKPCRPGTERGPLTGFWTRITLPRAAPPTFHYLSIDQVEEIRKNSREWNATKHRSCPPWYGMKTVARDWLNRQPKAGADAVIGEALRNDDIHGDAQPLQIMSSAGAVDGAPVGEAVAA